MAKEKTLRILVVDDNRDAADTMALLLTGRKKYEVRTAYSGKEAIGISREYQPEVVFMDVVMPYLNGIDTKNEINLFLPDCRIIAVSGMTHKDVREQCEAAGFFGFLIKPFETIDLLDILDKIEKEKQ